MKYYVIAGEASGDLHASHLIAALRAEDPGAEFRGFGGHLMAAEGMTLVRHYRDLAFMGVIDVALHATTILRGLRQCKSDIVAWQPDVVILVDYPGFNMKIAKFVHARHLCPVFYYIAPKLWAWKEWRINALRRDVDQVFSILPFEVDFFQGKHGVPIHYVGNPSVDEVAAYSASHASPATPSSAASPSTPPTSTFAALDGSPVDSSPSRHLAATPPSIAILCGSRVGEVRDNLWMMLAAAATHDDEYDIRIAAMSVIPRAVYDESLAKAEAYLGRKLRVSLVFDKTYEVLSTATAALVTSGTATLETALFDVPQVVCYAKRYPWLMATARRLLLKVPYVSLVNLIAGREVVRELILLDMSTEACRAALDDILPQGRRRTDVLNGYAEMRQRLGEPGAPRHAARLMTHHLQHPRRRHVEIS